METMFEVAQPSPTRYDFVPNSRRRRAATLDGRHHTCFPEQQALVHEEMISMAVECQVGREASTVIKLS